MNFMKRAGFVLTCATMLANLCAAQNTERTPQGMKCTTQGMDIRVEFYSPSIVRVYKTPEGKPYNKESLVVVKSPETVKVDFSEEAGQTVLKSSILKVLVNPATGGISFHTIAGNELLKDKDYGTSFADKNDAGTPSYQVRGSFLLDKDEPIYGVGQVMDGKFNRRNSMHHMQNENMFTYSPYFMSPVKGYAVYWDNYSISEFMDTPQELAFQSLGHCADYYFMYGGNADGIIAQVRDLTGHSPMLPLWAYGFFQSKERYHTQEESLNVLKKHRELQIPIDCMIQDWRYWPEYQKTDSAWNSLDEYKSLGMENVLLYPVGRKVAEGVKKLGFKAEGDFQHMADKPSYQEAAALAEDLMRRFLHRDIDKVELLYNHFRSTAVQVLTRETYLPIDLTQEKKEEDKGRIPDYIVEPSVDVVMGELLPKVLRMKMFTVLLDSNASEHAARTMAMQIATDNANDLLQDLTVMYNKSRQQAITNELLDIVGGSMA